MFILRHSLFGMTVTDKDDAEFRRAMSGARPLKSTERAPHAKPKPKPRARFTRADEREVLAESLEDDIDTIEHGYGAALRYHRQSVGKRTMRKLTRGGYSGLMSRLKSRSRLPPALLLTPTDRSLT